ncbi:MAG: lanthionine synthetase LanC family protein [Acidobacteriota bacterium]|nr:lanthionine synthetase LanC family protein [Acidobacteriota bacterium]
MLPPSFQKECLAEIDRIADLIMAEAVHTDKGMYWHAPAAGEGDAPNLTPSGRLFDGAAGVALFFLELSRIRGRAHWYRIAASAMKGSLAEIERNDPGPSLYFGRLGTAHVLLRFAEVSGEQGWLDRALALAPTREELADTELDCELLGGLAGILIGLLRLHEKTGSAPVLDAAMFCLDELLNRARVSETGLFWDRRPQAVRGLCGMGHGVAGIGLAFHLAAHYLGEPGLNLPGHMAYAYENSLYRTEYGGWPDYRAFYIRPGEQAAFTEAALRNDASMFERPRRFSFWCHGAAGIGLTRLRSYALTGDDNCLADFQRAADEVSQTVIDPGRKVVHHILCHGSFGNAALFLEAYRVLKEPQWLDRAIEATRLVFQERREQSGRYLTEISHHHDGVIEPGLMFGYAGIGWFLLQLTHPDQVPSVLCPEAAVPKRPFEERRPEFSEDRIYRRLLNHAFPRTASILQNHVPEFPSVKTCSPAEDIRVMSEEAAARLDKTAVLRLRDAYAFERKKLAFDVRLNPFYSRFKSRLKDAFTAGPDLAETELVLSDHVQLVRTRYNWCADDPGESGEYIMLLRLQPDHTEAMGPIPEPIAYLMEQFASPRNTTEVIARACTHFGTEPDQRDQMTAFILAQVSEAMKGGLLHRCSLQDSRKEEP